MAGENETPDWAQQGPPWPDEIPLPAVFRNRPYEKMPGSFRARLAHYFETEANPEP